MIRLTYSNRAEALVERLAEALDAFRQSHGPLDAPVVVIPSRQVGLFVKRALACRDGIAANLDLLSLGQFIERVAGGRPGGRRLAGAEAIFGALLGALLDEAALAGPRLRPVRTYLSGPSPEGRDRRRFQLARELSRLFEEYAYTRPDMLAAWARGEAALAGTEAAADEVWQRELFRLAFGAGGPLAAGAGAIGLHELLRAPLYAGPEVHLFGLTHAGDLVHRLLARIAERTTVHVYSLNPCGEFWEDAGEPGDTPPLVLWGRPGREDVRRLSELTGHDFTEDFEDPAAGATTLLRQIQRDILRREPERTAPDPAFDFAADRSLRLLSCPNPRREAEAIASEIGALVRDEPISFSDIAVLVAGPEPEDYLRHLAAAFDEPGFSIPHALDAPAPGPMAQAAALLLGLPGGRFTRAELLEAVTHPAVLGRFPGVDPEEWAARADALGIFREAARGGADEADLFNWDQGLRRLALGDAMLAGARPEPVVIGGEEYFPDEEGGRDSSASFGLLVRSLLSDATHARRAEYDAARWGEFLSLYLGAYLVAGEAEAEAERERCLSAVRSIAQLDPDLGGRRFGFPLAHEIARSRLSGVASRRSGRGGVVVSTLAALRSVPFRVIFIAGLDEKRFPAPPAHAPLDLRLARPRPGEAPPRERDQYLFLSTLLSARDRLYLSYVGRDEITGDGLAPSAAVVELLGIVRRGYRPWGDGPPPLVRAVPLWRKSEPRGGGAGAPWSPPEARVEAGLAALRREADAHGVPAGPEALREALPEEDWSRLSSRLGIGPPPRAAAAAAGAPARLSLSNLRRFLECPLQEGARTLLGLEEDREDRAALEAEPFEAARLEAISLQRELFERLARGPDGAGAEALLARLSSPRVAAGRLPEAGFFGRLEARRHLDVVEGSRAALARYLDENGLAGTRPETLRFGPAGEAEEVDAVLDPIPLPVAGLGELPLCGRVALLFGGRRHLISVRARAARPSKADEAARRAQETLGGFLDHVALCASGDSADRSVVLILHGEGGARGAGLGVARFAAIPRAEARAYLARLANELFAEVHDYLLPATAVFAFTADGGGGPFAAIVQEQLKRGLCASLYGPIRDPEAYRLLDDAEARARIERRFDLYFAARRAERAEGA